MKKNIFISLALNYALVLNAQTINSFLPGNLPQGRTCMVTIAGSGTHFMQATLTNFSFTISGSPTNNVIVDSLIKINDSILDLKIAVLAQTSIGSYKINYVSSADGNLQIGFTVSTPGTPAVVSFSPSSAKRGQTFDMIITGQNTAFLIARTTLTTEFMRQAIPSPFFKINSTFVLSDNLIKLNITVDSNSSAVGVYSLSVGDSVDGYLSPPYAFSVLNTGVSNILKEENSFIVYPNPVCDHLVIEMKNSNSQIEQIVISDLLGIKVFELQKPILQNGLIKFDAGELQLHSGTYFLSIRPTNGNYCMKILVE